MKGIQNTSSKTYRQIMGNGLRYEIPKFQRNYTWEAEQWDDLWQDIQTLHNNEEQEHYMGYLVLQSLNNKEFQVIDGQQRLTTMSLLILATLKCLDDLAEKNIESDKNTKRKEQLLNSYIGYIDPVTLVSNNKLKLNRNSDRYYRQYLVLLKELPLRNTNASEKHMRECFQWYYDKVKKKYQTGEQLAAFIDNFVDKLFFTVIEVGDQINAFKVFETLNARGVQLSASDLLKNYLFSVVDETKPHETEIEELEQLWSQMVGKLGEQKLEEYLRHYWNSEHPAASKKNLFKIIKNNIRGKAQVFELVRDMNDALDIYLAIQNPEDEQWNGEPEIKKHLKELRLFQIKQNRSLLLAAWKYDRTNFARLVKACAIITFRYNVIGGLNPNVQEEVYNEVALKISAKGGFHLSDFRRIYVSDYNFENDFATKEFTGNTRSHKTVRYILGKIEGYLHQHEIDMESDSYTVEHILPENADERWGDFSSDALRRSVYRLGNLALLERKLNQRAAQLPYSEKAQIFARSGSKLTQAIAEQYKSWSEAKLAERQRNLAKQAKAIWRIQELSD